MKKKALTAAVAAMLLLTTGVVMANPVEIDGVASFRYRADETDGAKKNGNITKIILNAKIVTIEKITKISSGLLLKKLLLSPLLFWLLLLLLFD